MNQIEISQLPPPEIVQQLDASIPRDRMLARFLDQCDQKKLTPGKEVGVISYNETPMKKYVKEGVTVISTDFELMGRKAAEFVTNSEPINFCIPTKMRVRSSL